MFRQVLRILLLAALLHVVGRAGAQQYQNFALTEGPTLTARIMSAKDAHLQLALEGGGYTNIQWGRFTQATIRQLVSTSRDKNVQRFAGQFVDVPASLIADQLNLKVAKPKDAAAAAPAVIKLQEVTRLPRTSSGGFFASPVVWTFVILFYLANIFAAYELGIFRNYPALMTAGVGAILPVVGPIALLCMPNRVAPPDLGLMEQPGSHEAMHGAITMAPVEEAPEPAAVAAAAAAAAAAGPPPGHTTFVRGQFTFNRRFFETKMAGFLKLVPGDAEKDKEIVVKSGRGDFVATRLTKVEATEVVFHVTEGNASKDVPVPFTELREVTIRPITPA